MSDAPSPPVPATDRPAGEGQAWFDLDALEPPDAVGRLLDGADWLGASDVVLAAEERYYSACFRHLGVMRRVSQLPHPLGVRCVAHVKGLAGLDTADRRRPQDGHCAYRRAAGEPVDLRVSTLPTLHGEDVSIRLHPRELRLLGLANLGLSLRDHQQLLRMLASPSGLILVTGPTGAGKTTTLYACLNHLNTGERKINTIEDPVEFALPGVRQSQVNPAIGLGFAQMLRGVLRQAPDVILIGEVRDAETATTAVRAANSGHLVLATLHAPSAAAAVQSMLHLGASPQHLAACLSGVVAQRLVRALNKETRVAVDPDAYAGLFEEVLPYLGPGEGRCIYGPPPGAAAQATAYTSRVGLFELMTVSASLRRLITQQQPTQALRQRALDEGMVSLRQSALIAVARGWTSLEEIFRVVPTDALLEE